MVSNKPLLNFPITAHDITNTKYIFGLNLACVRVKTVINKPSRVDTKEYVKITEDFYKQHKCVTLAANVMFFNGNVPIITSARKLNFVSVY